MAVDPSIEAGVPGDRLGIHTHNDTENAVAGSLAAIDAGHTAELDPALVTDSRRAFMPLGSRLTGYLTNAFTDYKPGPAQGSFMAHVRETGQFWTKKFWGRMATCAGWRKWRWPWRRRTGNL